MGQMGVMCHQICYNEKNTDLLLWYSSQCIPASNLNLIMRKKNPNQLKLRDIIQKNWPRIFKTAKVMELKERLKETQEPLLQLNATCKAERDPFVIKNMTATTGKMRMQYRLDRFNVLMLITWFQWFYLDNIPDVGNSHKSIESYGLSGQ